jgi:hypothetical protein
VARTSVELELTAQVEKAERALGKFTKDTQTQLDSISFNSAISAINAGFQIATVAAKAAARAFEFVVGEALSAEQGVQKLAKQMKLVGDFSDEAVAGFKEFADTLEGVSGVSDDAIIAAASLAKNFSLVNSDAKLAVEAALGLSQATGDDLNTAVEKVSKTFGGFIDRDLKRLIPELRNLTKEQLLAGDAAALIAKRFPVLADDSTLGGIQRLKNEFSDLAKEIGGFALPAINSFLGKLNQLIQNSKEFVGRDFNLQRQFEGSGGIDAFAKQGAAAFTQKNLGFTDAANRVAQEEAQAKIIAEKQLKAQLEAVKRLAEAREQAEKDYEGIRLSLAQNGLNDVEKLQSEFAQKRLIIEKAFQTGVINSEKEKIELIGKLELEEKRAVFEATIAFREKEAALAKKIAEEERAAKFGSLSQDSATQAAAGAVGNVTNGEQGAASTISSVVGGVVNAFLPGIGSIIQKIIDVLAGGPEKVKQFLESFIQGIPRVLTNILSSIPQVILSILREIPKSLIEFIKNGIPEIIQAFVENIPVIIQELIKYIPQLIIGLVKGLIEAIPKIVKGFITALVSQAGQFIDALVRALADVGSFFENVGSGIGDFFGGIFAQGGRVPNKPQYEGDRFPARLNAGEQVLDKDLTSRLEQYLNGGGGSGPSRIVIQIGQRELANVLLDVNNRGFRTA